MIEAPASRKIIQMILRLAEELDIPVVAEGIETPHEERLLAELGCAFGQGYLFGKPATLDRDARAHPPMERSLEARPAEATLGKTGATRMTLHYLEARESRDEI